MIIFKIKIDNNMSCSICLEKFNDFDNLKFLNCCNNKFHTECLDPWETQTNQCPLCRNSIDKNKPISKIKFDMEEQNKQDFQTAMEEQKKYDLEIAYNMQIENLFNSLRSNTENYICVNCNKKIYSINDMISCTKCGDYYYCSYNHCQKSRCFDDVVGSFSP